MEAVGLIEAVENTISILEAIQRVDGGVTAIASETGLAKSTVHDHLQTLEAAGYVVRDGSTVRLSSRFLRIGLSLRRRFPHSGEIERRVQRLAERTGERAHFAVLERTTAVFLFCTRGDDAVRTDVHPGEAIPLHASATGKAILAALPDSRLDGVLADVEFEPRTGDTIRSEGTLREELEQVRETGLAVSDGEYISALWTASVPVMDASDELLGAMSLSAPATRARQEGVQADLTAALRETVNELELDVTYGPEHEGSDSFGPRSG
jgi:DNA-binding IclR family transcriptional regulator